MSSEWTESTETEGTEVTPVAADASPSEVETAEVETVEDEAAEDAAPEAADEDGDVPPPVDPVQAFKDELRSKPGDWYVIHTYAGYENRVKANLENRIISLNMEDSIFEIQVPMEEVTEIKNGQKKLIKRVRYTGYVLVRMDLTDSSWGAVRHTPGVTGFVGNAHDPFPLSFDEAFDMLKPKDSVRRRPRQQGPVPAPAPPAPARSGRRPRRRVRHRHGGPFETLARRSPRSTPTPRSLSSSRSSAGNPGRAVSTSRQALSSA